MKTSKFSQAFKVLSVFSLAALLSACGGASGGNPFVRGAQFLTGEENGDLYGELKVLLGTGNVMMPAFDIPILNPKVPGAVYGVVSMREQLGEGSQLGIRVNLSQISGIDGADGSVLPNGRAIPVVVGGGVRPVAVQIQEKSRVYLAFGENTALMGGAIVIKEFDKIAQNVGAIDVFFPFQAENGVRGAAGLFSSARPGESGLAVFVDVGSVLKSQQGFIPGRLASASSKLSVSSASDEGVSFQVSQRVSSAKAYRLSQYMKKLGEKRQRLTLQ